MKFVKYATLAIAFLVSNTEAMKLSTLPDVRSETPTEADIAAHERARKDAARVRYNYGEW